MYRKLNEIKTLRWKDEFICQESCIVYKQAKELLGIVFVSYFLFFIFKFLRTICDVLKEKLATTFEKFPKQ
jgi:hypothetical protein